METLKVEQYGPLFVGARLKGHGAWSRDVPPYVQAFFGLYKNGFNIYSNKARSCEELKERALHLDRKTKIEETKGLIGFRAIFKIPEPPKVARKSRKKNQPQSDTEG